MSHAWHIACHVFSNSAVLLGLCCPLRLWRSIFKRTSLLAERLGGHRICSDSSGRNRCEALLKRIQYAARFGSKSRLACHWRVSVSNITLLTAYFSRFTPFLSFFVRDTHATLHWRYSSHWRENWFRVQICHWRSPSETISLHFFLSLFYPESASLRNWNSFLRCLGELAL